MQKRKSRLEKWKNNGYIVCQDQNMAGQLEHGETGWYTICQEQKVGN